MSARSGETVIRPTRSDDRNAIEAIYREAFPDEDLIPLLRRLLDAGDAVVSLAAETESRLSGHIVLTPCAISETTAKAWLLGPLAVAPDRQRHGIGTALMREGIARSGDAGAARVMVLGDPRYYGRIGFSREDGIAPPYTLPPEWDGAWQSIAIDDGATKILGTLQVPEFWRDEKLWLP